MAENLEILVGDCRAILPTLESGSVQTCVTSPPYWGLRDYGTAQWEGERTPALRNGSCDSTLKRRDTHSIECRSSLPELQRQQRQPLRNRRSVWTIPTQPYAEAHFATFPEEIPKLCILAGSKPGDTILDPFAGSGTVGKVALELGRRAVLIELNPTYIELARDRTFVTPGFF